jgi:hypothetical protein
MSLDAFPQDDGPNEDKIGVVGFVLPRQGNFAVGHGLRRQCGETTDVEKLDEEHLEQGREVSVASVTFPKEQERGNSRIREGPDTGGIGEAVQNHGRGGYRLASGGNGHTIGLESVENRRNMAHGRIAGQCTASGRATTAIGSG